MERVGEATSPNQALDRVATLTIASGAITIHGPGVYTLLPETGTADVLDRIIDTNCPVGSSILLMADATGVTPASLITIAFATHNIDCASPYGASVVLGPGTAGLRLCQLVKYTTTNWAMVGADLNYIPLGPSGQRLQGYADGTTAYILLETAGGSTTGAELAVFESPSATPPQVGIFLWPDILLSPVAAANVPVPDPAGGLAVFVDIATGLLSSKNHAGAVVALTGTHDLVTLDANAATLLGLTGQALGLHTVDANKVWSGPVSGAAAVPTPRALVPADTPYVVCAEVREFTETAVAGTYTATVVIPATGDVHAVWFSNQVCWTNVGTAQLTVGDDDDPNGYFDAIDVKTTPAADVNGAGGMTASGAYAGLIKHCATQKTITATIVTTGATGSAGRSRLKVRYAVPVPVAAVKT